MSDNRKEKECDICQVVLGNKYHSLKTESSQIYVKYLKELGIKPEGYLCCSRINKNQSTDQSRRGHNKPGTGSPSWKPCRCICKQWGKLDNIRISLLQFLCLTRHPVSLTNVRLRSFV